MAGSEFDAILGGTFNPIHDGHRRLLRTAFELGDTIVGLTSDALAQKTRDEERPVDSYVDRKESLETEVQKLAREFDRRYEIRKVTDPFDHAVSIDGVTYIVVSPEPKTVKRAKEINNRRRENGMEPLRIVVTPSVYAEDGERISSTRIVKGEIDSHGNLR